MPGRKQGGPMCGGTKWRKSDVFPKTAEQDTSISGSAGSRCFSNSCPEVSYESFGVFATSLAEYVDEIDRDLAHRRLSKNVVPVTNWEWKWAAITPMHYTECPLYSLLTPRADIPPRDHNAKNVLTLKPGMWGMSVDLKELWRWVKSRFKRSSQSDR